MIPEIKELNFPKKDGNQYATLSQATVSIADMGEKSITSTIKIDGDIVPDFSFNWAVEFQGEKYIMPLRVPQGTKDNASLKLQTELTFQHWAVYQLKRWSFISTQQISAGTYLPDEEVASITLNLKDFCALFGQVLEYYYGDAIRIDLNPEWQYDSEPVHIEISHTKIWDVLTGTFYDKFGARWEIKADTNNDNLKGNGERYVIRVGYPTAEVDHIFEYGFKGGLLKIERQVQSDEIRNILKGRGGDTNIPFRYFKGIDSNNPDFSADPDWVTELQNIYFPNLMGATFRSYIQGWKAAHISDYPDYTAVGEKNAYAPWAYKKGYTDTKFAPVEFVADEITINPDSEDNQTEILPDYAPYIKRGSSIDKYGALPDTLDNNDDIYPTLQGTGLDIAVDVEQIESDDIEASIADDIQTEDITFPSIVVRNAPSGHGSTQKYFDFHRTTAPYRKFTIPEGKVANIQCNAGWLAQDPKTGENKDALLTDVEYKLRVFNSITKEEVSASGIPAGLWEFTAEFTYNNASKSRLNFTFTLNNVKIVSATPDKTWKGTFDIWVKNIWGSTRKTDETDVEYSERVWRPILGDREGNEAKVMFTSGALAMSEDYEFLIVGYPVPDTSKTWADTDGVKHTSYWKITLAKSDAEYETSGFYVPSTKRQGKAGDTFVFIDTEMLHNPYVTDAEIRLDNWKKDQLSEKKEIKPTFVVSTDRVRINNGGKAGGLIEQLRVGNSVRLADKRLIQPLGDRAYETLYLQSITYTYREPSNSDNALNPDVEMVLGEEYETSANAVSMMQGEISALQKQVGSISNIEQIVRAVGDKLYLRKDGISDRSLSPTQFFSLLTSGDFRSGLVGGVGWGMRQDENGKWVFETDRVIARQDLTANTFVINQAEGKGGMEIDSAAVIETTEVEDTATGYVCYFDTKNGSIGNLFHVDDIAYCNRWTADNAALKYYRRRVTAVGVDNITLSKTDVDGSGEPAKDDCVIHFGSYSDKTRQYIKVRDVVGGGYERYIEGLNSVNAEGIEYYFVGKQAGESRWFVGYKDIVPNSGEGDGSYIEFINRKFNLHNVKISVESTIGDKIISDYIKEVVPPIEQEDIESYVNAIVDPKIEEMQNQIDGVIETWFSEGEPTLNNIPASDWATDALKNQHLGDLYYDNNTGTAYRFSKSDEGAYVWVVITDEAITKALSVAQNAQDTADGKRRVFTSNPTDSDAYDAGDLWVNATYGTQYSNDLLRCVTEKQSGKAFNITHWALASKYTDDALAQSALDRLAKWAEDGIFSPTEKSELELERERIDSDKAKFDEQYAIFSNSQTSNSDLTIAKTAYDTAYSAYRATINSILGATPDKDGCVAVPSDFETKMQEYYTVRAQYDYSMTQELKKYTDTKMAQYGYLRKALGDVSTTIGGVFLTSHIRVGEHNEDLSTQVVWSGLNGVRNKVNGRDISYWAGGDMIDLFNDDDTRKTFGTGERPASSVIRMDGSAYFAKGNIGFKADGSGWLGNDLTGIKFTTGGAMTFGSGLTIDVSNVSGLSSMLASLTNFNTALATLFVPCDANGNELAWTVATQSDGAGGIKAKSLKAKVGLWSADFISAMGLNTTSGSGSGATQLRMLDDVIINDASLANGQVLVYNGTKWVNSSIGLNEALLASYLTENNYAKKSDIPSLSGYATQSWVSGQNYLTGTEAESTYQPKGSYLTSHQAIYALTLQAGAFSGGTYNPKLGEATVNIPTTTSHISEGSNLYFTNARAVSALKATTDALNTAIGKKLDTATFTTFKALFDSMFEKEEDSTTPNGYRIKAKFGLYSTDFISAMGLNSTSGGSGVSYGRLDSWADYDASAGDVLSATLGYGLRNDISGLDSRIGALEGGSALSVATTGSGNAITALSKSGTTITATKGATFLTAITKAMVEAVLTGDITSHTHSQYLTSHQAIYALTIQKNGTAVGTFNPKSASATINLADVASASTLSSHTSNTTVHITSAERTKWNKVVTDFTAITGEDTDNIINKWEEVVAFLGTYTEADTLANLLSNKVDKVAGKGLSTNDFTDALLTKLNGIEAGANKYVHPSATATVISAATGKVLSAITVNSLGHVTSVSSKTLVAGDIPSLSWSKITSGKPTTLAGYGITDGVNAVSVSGSGNAVTSASVSGHTLTLTKGATYLPKSTFDDLFEKINIGTSSAPVYAIKAKYGLYSDSFISAMGVNSSGGSGSGSNFGLMKTWPTTPPTTSTTDALGANLGYELHQTSINHATDIIDLQTRLDVVEGAYVAKSAVVNTAGVTKWETTNTIATIGDTIITVALPTSLPKKFIEASLTGDITSHTHSQYLIEEDLDGLATESWVTNKGYLTSHQAVSNKAVTLAWGTTSTIATIGSTNITVKLPSNPNTDTKDTAGSSDTSSKIYLVGATSQATSATTYSHDTAYVGTDGCLYSGGVKVLTSHQSLSGYATQSWVTSQGYLKSSSLSGYATQSWVNDNFLTIEEYDSFPIPTALSQLKNDIDYVRWNSDSQCLSTGSVCLVLPYLTSITKSMVENVLTGNITSHTHSQYLTSHQSLENYVTLNTAQTISGPKAFSTGIKICGHANGSNGGDDEGIVVEPASNSWATVCLGNPAGDRSSFCYQRGTNLVFWRTAVGGYYYDIQHPKKNGTIALTSDLSSYLTKADVASTYLPLSGGTMTGAIKFTTDGSAKIGGDNTYGALLQYGSVFLNAKLSGLWRNDQYRIWDAGNDGSGSGLDADLLDGYHKESFEGYLYTEIDASALDKNTWYPVTMGLNLARRVRIRIEGQNSATWSTHPTSTYAAVLDYSVSGYHWGWTEEGRVVNYFHLGAGAQDTNCIAGLGQLTNSSVEYVYVRGGGKYNFYTSHWVHPVLRSSTYTVNSQSVSPTTTSPTAITRDAVIKSDLDGLLTSFRLAGDNKNIISLTVGGTTKEIFVSPWEKWGRRMITKNDNNGYPGFILISDITSWKGTTGGSYSYGFVGRIIESRYGGYIGERITDVTCRVGYSDVNSTNSVHLRTSNNNVTPYIVSYNSKYYLALKVNYAGHEVTFDGVFHNCLSEFIQLNWGSSSELPSGVVDLTSSYTRYLYADYAASTAQQAVSLQTSRTLWGQSFDGTANVSGNMTGVGSISASGAINTTSSISMGAATMTFNRTNGPSYLRTNDANGYFVFITSGDTTATANSPLVVKKDCVYPGLSTVDLGSDTHRWQNVYARGIWANRVEADNISSKSTYVGAGLMNGGVIMQTGAFGSSQNLLTATSNKELQFHFPLIDVDGVNYATMNDLAATEDWADATFSQLGHTHSQYLTSSSLSNYYTKTQSDNRYLTPSIASSTFATLSTAQTISGKKTFSGGIGFGSYNIMLYSSALTFGYGSQYDIKLGQYGLTVETDTIFNGMITTNGGIDESSDARLKNIQYSVNLDIKDIANAPSVAFLWTKNGKQDVGSIAQYWRNLCPLLTRENSQGFFGMNYGKTALLSVISVAKKTISLEERVKVLEEENAQLKNQLDLITKQSKQL